MQQGRKDNLESLSIDVVAINSDVPDSLVVLGDHSSNYPGSFVPKNQIIQIQGLTPTFIHNETFNSLSFMRVHY